MLEKGHGRVDYLLYLNGRAAGIVEAKKAGETLSGVEIQAKKYSEGLPATLPAHCRPLPFLYQSTGIETRFTNGYDPEPRSRPVFSFHRPETLLEWIDNTKSAKPFAKPLGELPGEFKVAEPTITYLERGKTFLDRMQHMPPLVKENLWKAQIEAIEKLEISLKQNRPRTLIQMATGSGKTFTAINIIYRLLKFAGAKRILFLVDRGNLADQTLKEFQQFGSPYNNFKFTEEYIA